MADAVRSSRFAMQQSSLKTNSYQEGNSVKKLINDICNGENTKNVKPGVVARLMGLDTSPPKTGPTVHTKECFEENLRQRSPNMSNCKGAEVDFISPLNCKQQYFIPSIKSLSFVKPTRREHPHEEQLKKFKKEFEAWQDSKLWEFSSNLYHCSGEDLEKEQFFALETFKKEKMAAYANTFQRQKKPDDTEDYILVNNLKINQNDGNFGVRKNLAAKSFEIDSNDKFMEKKIAPFSPSRIVILKPSSDSPEQPPRGSPEVVIEKGRSMEDFLEEVREKLKLEMEGKGSDSTRRFSLGHTSLHENSMKLKHAAREAEKQAMLRRSQSMITYRNSFHFDGDKSSKSIKSATRKFIADRLKNVLNEASFTAFSNEGKDDSFWEDNKAMNESIPKNIRLEPMKMVSLDDESLSPSNFVGSFSASFSEAQKLQKNEEFNNDSVVPKKRKNDGFNIKSRVSNLRRNLGLKAKFFGKKVPSMGDTTVEKVHYVKPAEAYPSIIGDFGIVQDNSTEVPPSPASFPCSPINVHYSPVSPLEDLFADDHSSTQVSGELSMLITELGSQPKLSEIEKSEMETQTQLHNSNETIITEACAEAYIRDILLVSDSCNACWPLDQPTSRLDRQINPISSCLCDHVEPKSRLNPSNVDDYNSKLSLGDIHIDRKMFFDLVKEALPTALDAPLTQFVSKRSTRNRTRFHHGERLIDDLLDQIHVYATPKIDQPKSMDKLVVWDLKFMPWSDESNEEISSLCGEVEWVIIGELIDDLLLDILV